MFTLPSPLHPAVVHFPIALILLGTVVVAASVFLRRWQLPWIAACLISLGALGAIAAAWTGSEDEESVGELGARGEQVLEEHEEWGERARNASIVAALLAVASAGLGRFAVASRVVSVAAACAAVVASLCVASAGHYGGESVYRHGAGVNMTAGTEPVRKAHHDDDD